MCAGRWKREFERKRAWLGFLLSVWFKLAQALWDFSELGHYLSNIASSLTLFIFYFAHSTSLLQNAFTHTKPTFNYCELSPVHSCIFSNLLSFINAELLQSAFLPRHFTFDDEKLTRHGLFYAAQLWALAPGHCVPSFFLFSLKKKSFISINSCKQKRRFIKWFTKKLHSLDYFFSLFLM